MPFIIIVATGPCRSGAGGDQRGVNCQVHDTPVSRGVVATQEEAQAAGVEIVLNIWDRKGPGGRLGKYEAPLHAVRSLPSEGTTITTPDGTVIAVEPRAWSDIARDVGCAWGKADEESAERRTSVLAEWNAKYGDEREDEACPVST